MIKYTQDHEWVRLDGEEARVGISDYAQKSLGDVVFVELPEEGRTLARGDEVAVVESVKAASEVYAPVGGTVTGINATLEDEPGQVNESPEGDGWFFTMTLSDSSELEGLMDAAAYADFVATLD
ncbi:glycine cleavage system protein GcvH [Yunchengibacter salinarum]|uniref:glycine cleavage system protein GcvH n=1 Tax=Yunchengibacter salinarum TaxID=3133399 RepID=UPI0035B5C707